MLGQPQPIWDVSRSLGTILFGHLLVLGMAIAIRHFVLYRAPLYERINSGDINFKPFPPLPYDVVIEPAYNDDGEEIGTQTFHEEIYPVDLIFDAQGCTEVHGLYRVHGGERRSSYHFTISCLEMHYRFECLSCTGVHSSLQSSCCNSHSTRPQHPMLLPPTRLQRGWCTWHSASR